MHVTSQPRILRKARPNHISFLTYITSSTPTRFKTWVSNCTQHSVMLFFTLETDPGEYVARVVGHDQTILYEIPSEVVPHVPAIQADFRASGDRLLDHIQQQKESQSPQELY